MNCKFCNGQLPEDVTLCPHCGKEQEAEQVADEVTEEVTEKAIGEVAETATAEASTAAETPESTEAQTDKLPFAKDYEAQVPAESGKAAKASPGKIALAVVAGVLVLAILVSILATGLKSTPAQEEAPTVAPTSGEAEETEPATEPVEIIGDGDPASPVCKASYTVSEEEAVAAADVVVATMGDRVLTNGQLQAFYWQEVYSFLSENGQYAEYMGLDISKPLDEQLFTFSDTPLSWQQFFLDGAISTWKTYQAMELESANAGFRLTQAQQAEFDSDIASLEDAAVSQGFADAASLLKERVGAGCTLDAYTSYARVAYYCMAYYDYYAENLSVTEEELDAHFAENEEYYTSSNLSRDSKYVDVRHVLLQPEGGETGEDGYPVYTDDAWEACRRKAEQLYTQWQAGDRSEESFAQLAVDHSEDGNAASGGLYTDVYVGQMVESFENWCFDEARQIGDHGLVKTPFGYHIMFFSGSRGAVETNLRAEKAYALLNTVVEKYPAEVDFSLVELDALSIY